MDFKETLKERQETKGMAIADLKIIPAKILPPTKNGATIEHRFEHQAVFPPPATQGSKASPYV